MWKLPTANIFEKIDVGRFDSAKARFYPRLSTQWRGANLRRKALLVIFVCICHFRREMFAFSKFVLANGKN